MSNKYAEIIFSGILLGFGKKIYDIAVKLLV